MAFAPRDFTYSDSPEPHRMRTREIIKIHPEMRRLVGRNPWSLALIVGIVGLQIGIAILLRGQAWWLALATAYVIGAFADHALFVLIHECAHNLLFQTKTANIAAGILADVPMFVPASVSFRSYHLKHHSFQGHYDLDADLASRWEARLIGSSLVGKAMWLLLFPVFQALRPPRLREIRFVTGWTLLDWFVGFGTDVAVLLLLGPVPFLYLVASLFFSIGLHPLGARWIQEHYLVYPDQETCSYYGPANIVALNVGFHNEHHDFPSVPWNRLPLVKRTAPEWYDSLHSHRSWLRLLFLFLSDPRLSLYSRVLRTDRGGVPTTGDYVEAVSSLSPPKQ